MLAAVEAGVSAATAIVAPHFQTSDDDPEADEPFWSSAGWKQGNLSRPEGPSPRVSSYAGLDRMVDAFLTSSRFPAMREIVVAGHSAGGQVVHRFAATTEHKAAESGIGFRYVVTNPSTYLYPGPEREDAAGDFTVPEAGCDDYDDWHYGLRERNSYADRLHADSIRAQLVRGDVRILLGDADTTSTSLDQTCGANLQGPAPLPPRPRPGPLHGRAVRRARPPGDDRAGCGALQPADVAVGGGGGGALRQLTAACGSIGGWFQRCG